MYTPGALIMAGGSIGRAVVASAKAASERESKRESQTRDSSLNGSRRGSKSSSGMFRDREVEALLTVQTNFMEMMSDMLARAKWDLAGVCFFRWHRKWMLLKRRMESKRAMFRKVNKGKLENEIKRMEGGLSMGILNEVKTAEITELLKESMNNNTNTVTIDDRVLFISSVNIVHFS